MNARLIPPLCGALLLASAGAANAESIATGCLAKNGTIHSVQPYSNNTLAACRKGDQIIRFAIQQPDTKFSKQRATIPFESGQEMATFAAEAGPVGVDLRFAAFPIGLDPVFGDPAPTNACELYLFTTRPFTCWQACLPIARSTA